VAKKLKLIFEHAPELTIGTTIDEAMNKLTTFVCDALECDRATIYAFDPLTSELWSKAASGSKTVFRVPLGKGLAGSCAEMLKVINIIDAYNDSRFNKEYDKASGYRTKSVLVVHVLDKSGNPQGVIHAINKLGGKDREHTTHFSSDDVGLLKMISRLAGLFLKSSISFTKQAYFSNSIK